MEQNPYCYRCRNSLVIREENEKIIGICDKCHIINELTKIERENYLHNETCKIRCSCGGTAYVHNNNNFYYCFCCFKKIPLELEIKTYLEEYKKIPLENKKKEEKAFKKFKEEIPELTIRKTE